MGIADYSGHCRQHGACNVVLRKTGVAFASLTISCKFAGRTSMGKSLILCDVGCVAIRQSDVADWIRQLVRFVICPLFTRLTCHFRTYDCRCLRTAVGFLLYGCLFSLTLGLGGSLC